MAKRHETDLMDVALRAGVSYHVALGWALRGRIRAERIDGRWRVDAASVERFLANRAHREPAPAA